MFFSHRFLGKLVFFLFVAAFVNVARAERVPAPLPLAADGWQLALSRLKNQAYAYEASLGAKDYFKGEHAEVRISAYKGKYPVAGKPVKIVASVPLTFEILRGDTYQAERLEQDVTPDAEVAFYAPRITLDMKTDETGEIRLKFPVKASGSHTLHIFFLHPVEGYNQHVIELAYRVVARQQLLMYVLLPWLSLLMPLGFIWLKKRAFYDALDSRFTRLARRYMSYFIKNLSEEENSNVETAARLDTTSSYGHVLYPRLNYFNYRNWERWSGSFYFLGFLLGAILLGAGMLSVVGEGIWGAASICLGLLLLYGWLTPMRTSLVILFLALGLQYYIYTLYGGIWEGWERLGQQTWWEIPFALLLALQIWFPMPLAALSLYSLDKFYYQSPVEEWLGWVALVACLSFLTLLWARVPLKRRA